MTRAPRQRPAVRLSPETEAEICRLYALSLNPAEIEKATGVNRNTVRGAIERHDVHRPAKRPVTLPRVSIQERSL